MVCGVPQGVLALLCAVVCTVRPEAELNLGSRNFLFGAVFRSGFACWAKTFFADKFWGVYLSTLPPARQQA